jgi:hypothetical protein
VLSFGIKDPTLIVAGAENARMKPLSTAFVQTGNLLVMCLLKKSVKKHFFINDYQIKLITIEKRCCNNL